MPSRRRRRALPKEPVTVDIESLSHEGRGIAHIEGKVVFVDGALPGEQVQASYVRRRGKFDELSTQTVLQASSQRVDPGCEYAGTCGGCSLRHMAPQEQLQFKQSVLLEQLEHNANIKATDFELLPMMTGDTRHYRRKARLAVRLVEKKGGALVGFREKYSTFITVMSDCQVLSAEVANLIPVLRQLISSMDGATEIPQIEVAVGESAAEVTAAGVVALIFRHLKPLTDADLERLIAFAESHQIQLYLQPAGPDSVHKVFPEGEERLQYYLPDSQLKLNFHPQDFTQVNASINRQIVSRSLDMLGLTPADRVLDLFCGLGNFTLPMAQHCGEILGVEGSEEMVRRGEENAAQNGISNARFISDDLSKAIDRDWLPASYDKILLDPPRSGALEILPQLIQCNAQKILYISCNPATLSRDAGVLRQAGYKLKSAGVMDMFPHTTHVESMALFTQD